MRTSTPTPQSISYQGDLSSNPRTDEHHMTNNGLYPDREFDPTQDTPPKKAGHPSNRHSVDVQASLKRDHSILKKSYDAIFQNSFINPQVLTILPFYLQTTFPNMTLSFPVVNMYIPSPSVPDRCLQRTYATFRHSSDSVTLVDDPSTIFSAVRNDQQNDIWPTTALPRDEVIDITSYHTHMHLGRSVALIRACKEAAWIQYEKLHRHQRAQPNSSLDREDFEMYFRNWEW